MDKQPIGLTPEYIWKEARVDSIKAAIKRYLDCSMEIPDAWIEEYNSHLRDLKQ